MVAITEQLKKKLLHHLKVTGEGNYKELSKEVQKKLVKHFSRDELKEGKK